jgi:hypothetical protein
LTSKWIKRLFVAGAGAEHTTQTEEDNHRNGENDDVERIKNLGHGQVQLLSG